MKLLILLVALAFCSCQKEFSQEGNNESCGTVTAINIWPTHFTMSVLFGIKTENYDIGILDLPYYKIGDTFCK